MYETVLKGGYAMIPLLFCSLLSLAVIIEKGFALRSRAVLPPRLLLTLRDDPRRTADLIERDRSPLAGILRSFFLDRKLSRRQAADNLRLALRRQADGLERGLVLLEIVAVISPLLGLLGTVLGMVEVFKVISQLGVGQAQAMSGGIAQALITTIAGLIVAIPALAAHSLYSRKVDRLLLNLEEAAEACLPISPDEEGQS